MYSPKQTFVALDQFINTLVYIKTDGFGWADETLSARAWRLKDYSSIYKFLDKLFFWETAHCLMSYTSEVNRNQLPPEYREK
jgi:hypothetical protein